MVLQIDVISDVVCPWCFIGQKKLARALALYRAKNPAAEAPKVIWHPFQLNPGLPEAGVDRAEYLRRKFGERSGNIYARVSAIGAQVGIPFAFDKVVRQPNTLAAHSLIALAAEAGRQNAVVEAFFRAYFIEGRDLTSNETLVEVACGAGLEREAVERCLASEEARAHVQEEDEEARSLGVDGVPFFIFNRRHSLSGAQDPEALLETMLKAESEAQAPNDA